MSWQQQIAGAAMQAYGPSMPFVSQTYTPWESTLGLPSAQSIGLRSGSSGPSWSGLSTGQYASSKAITVPKYTPAAFPERINAVYPYSANRMNFGQPPPFVPTNPQVPAKPKPGDLLGEINANIGNAFANVPVVSSFAAAIGNTVANLTLGNAIPYFMERVNVLADEFAKNAAVRAVPGFNAAKAGLDAFSTGVVAASHVIAPVLDAFPNWLRDSQLGDRAKLYREITSGQAVDYGPMGPVSNPLAIFGQVGGFLSNPGAAAMQAALPGPDQGKAYNPLEPIFGRTVSDEANQANNWRKVLLTSVDPNARWTAAQHLEILRSSLDIPPSVKAAIDANPNLSNEALDNLMLTAPEGKAWSYQGGLRGTALNMATPIFLYGVEAMAAGPIGRGVSAFGTELGGAGAGLGARVVSSAIMGGGKAVTVAAALQKYAMAAGLGTTILTTTMDGIARTMGNQAAIDWFARVNQTSKFSNDAQVQLVTGFSVNPLEAIKLTAAGGGAVKGAVGKVAHIVTLPLAKGLGEIPITAALGRRMTTFASSETLMTKVIGQMYNVDAHGAGELIARNYDHKQQAFDEVLGVAIEEVATRSLSDIERATINASIPDPVANSMFYINNYADQAMTLLEKDSGAVAKRWQVQSWGHHNYPGGFNTEVAAKNARDARGGRGTTYDLRAEQNAVLAYREALPPEAQALATARLDSMTAADGTIAVEGLQGVQGLIVDFPVLRNHWTGLITTETRIPRSSVERMIGRATEDWNRLTNQNPVLAKTGSNPILRPGPWLTRDTVEALGTTRETLAAINDKAPNADGLSAIRQFLVDKTGLSAEQAAALPDAEAIANAQKYVADTTKPWLALGESVVAAERQLVTVRADLVRLRAMPKYATQHDQIAAAERDVGALLGLTRSASDPLVTFGRSVVNDKLSARPVGRDILNVERAGRKAEAITQLNELAVIHDAGVAAAGDGWHSLFSMVEGNVMYSGGLPPVTRSVRRALDLPQTMGDYDAWSWIGRNLADVRHKLTKAQANSLNTIVERGGWKHLSPDETIKGEFGSGMDAHQTLESLGRLWSERRGILSGTNETRLRATAEMKLPRQYMALADEMVANGTTERAIIDDPRFVTVVHPGNVARLEDALSAPDTYPAVRDILRNDPVLEKRYMDFADSQGWLNLTTEVPAGVRQRFVNAIDRLLIGEPAVDPMTGDVIAASTSAAGEVGAVYYRGTNPVASAAGKRITSKDAWWDSHLFVTDAVKHAKNYGPQIEQIALAKDARILKEGSRAFQRLNVAALKAETGNGMLGWASHIAKNAEQAGYDAVHFDAQGGIGTIILNESKITRNFKAASDHALADLSSRLTNLDAQGMPTVDTWLVDGFEVKFNYDPLADPAHMFQLREALIPKDFVRPTPSVIPLLTPLDRALHAADKGALETLARDFVLSDKPTMPTAVPERVAIKVVKNAPAARPSTRYARKLAETDGTASPSAAILDAPNNRIGVDALSWLNHGVSGTQPATINGVVALLRRIEDGYPRKAGMGDGVAAEAQRVANEILDAAVKDRPKGDTTGIFTKGQFPDDEVALADQLHNLLTYDQSNPLGTLQYGLAKRPQAAVVLEWSRVVPGLAEELMSKRFMPYTERVWNTHTREAFNWIFGPRSNAAIRAESEMRFLQRAAAEGVDGTIAKEIHSAWRKMALESRSKTILKSKTGEMKATLGDNPLYADVHNIPNSALQAEALTVVDKLLADGKVSNLDNYAKTLRSVNYDRLFREAGSFTRRHLDDAGNGPLGPALAQAYGMVAHNKAITTLYYQFRFAMDVRFHAMNYMEAQFLYTGRAGAKPGEIDQGMFGYNGDYLRSMGADAASNTGYAFSHDRHSWAYRTFLKEQPDAMRKALKGLQSEDPAMMRKALKQMAQHDPQLQNMIQKFDGTTDPTKYLKELNDWHGKMLNNATLDETAMVIDQSIADALVGSPELAQVYAKLGEVNKNLWDDVRQTFYGNPDRSRAERFLNSYLLYWPLSYQIKSTKWFAKILFDRAGGIQTNALGAVLVDRMATTHQQLLATDPQYKDWFEKNKTLVFLAQMLFPVSFESTGVSMSPFLRDSFFGRSRAIWDIGPIYTATHVVPQVGKEIYKDLYPTLKDVPGYSEIYSMATGKAPPKVSFADAGNAPYVPPEAPVPLTPAKAPNSP